MNYSEIQGVIFLEGCPTFKRIFACQTSEFSLNLQNKRVWDLGIDQSSTCTGLAIRSTDNAFTILLDVHRSRCMDKELFYRELKYLLKRIAKGHKFRFVVNELPVPGRNKNSGNVLRELLGRLNEWISDIPEFSSARHEQLFPQTWKSLVMDKKKGKNRSNIKAEVAADVSALVPATHIYYEGYPYTDYDSFDALGILEGFKRYAFDADGVELIHGLKENRHTSLVCYKWMPAADAYAGLLKAMFGQSAGVFKPVFLGYNSRYNFNSNVRMASSNWDVTLTVIPAAALQPFQWKFNIDITQPDHMLIAAIFRKGVLSRSALRALENEFNCMEDIYAE